MAEILVVDDDRALCNALGKFIEGMGHAVHCVHSLAESLALLREQAIDLVVLDIHLPDGNGVEALPEVVGGEDGPEVMVITGGNDSALARAAMEGGAWDYLRKPVSREDLTLHVERALQHRQEKRAAGRTRLLRHGGLLGESPAMQAVFEAVARAADSDCSVLVTGETGTGKELISRAIHENSRRSAASLVVVDCAALPDHLVESVLFGHVRGAFTGADRDQVGLVKQADGGTLFLDEVGELPLAMQRAFLRVLQERCFRPVGARQEVRSDFRLVAATNRDLEAMARAGTFREDLLFRLRTMAIQLPPLRERLRDLIVLTAYHMERVASRLGTPVRGFSPEFTDALFSYDWPGNVRELVSALESAMLAAGSSKMLYANHLPVQIRLAHVAESGAVSSEPNGLSAGNGGTDADDALAGELPPFKEYRRSAVERAERRYLESLIARAAGNAAAACRMSGLSRSRLYELLKKSDLTLDG